MVEISNSDIERILNCLDIAIAHYKSLKGAYAIAPTHGPSAYSKIR